MSRAVSTSLRFLALGDSYTIGESVDPHERWPVRLAEELNRHGLPTEPPKIIATTGWTTTELGQGMDGEELEADWDLVSLLIGVNDQYRGHDIESYRRGFADLLDRAIGLARGRCDRVFVLSIPDWALTPFGQASDRDVQAECRAIASFNRVNEELSRQRGVLWLDITPSTQRVQRHPELVADDGLHPSAALYSDWVGQILHPVMAQLRP